MCKHRNGLLHEWMLATHERVVEDGEMEDEGANEMGLITHYTYRCRDCGKKYRFPDMDSAPLKFLREQSLSDHD